MLVIGNIEFCIILFNAVYLRCWLLLKFFFCLTESSSLWPLLYGENSKQLDDYIHRIYCRDCQKSQEQFPVGEKSDGENYQPKNIIGAHLEPKKCQLLHHRDADESFACEFRHS